MHVDIIVQSSMHVVSSRAGSVYLNFYHMNIIYAYMYILFVNTFLATEYC